MRKVDDKKKEKRTEKKIMSFLVATNVIASWPPKRWPTGMPHARAKIAFHILIDFFEKRMVKGFVISFSLVAYKVEVDNKLGYSV